MSESSKVLRVPIALVPLIRSAVKAYKAGEQVAAMKRLDRAVSILKDLDQAA